METALRFLPMPVTGIICSILCALLVGHLDAALLICTCPFCIFRERVSLTPIFEAGGTLMTGLAGLLFALIVPSAPYWAFGFPAAIVVVFGADLVQPTGALFIAKVSFQNEQSMAQALFQTLSNVSSA